MASSGSKRIDLTQGPPVKGIVSFALPLLASSIIQQLYSTVDLLFVGNILGTSSIAAVGIGVLLIACLVGFLTGASTGSNVVIAQAFGAGDERRVRSGLASSVALGLMLGAALALVGWLSAPSFVAWMRTPAEAADDALAYLRVYFIAMVAVSLYNLCAGASRALGDSSTPMVAQAVGGVMNIAANWLFLCALGMGVEGVALATLLSNLVAAGLVAQRLFREGGLGADGGMGAHIDFRQIRAMLAVGLPIGIQAFAISLSNVFVQHQINLMGVDTVAAFATYFKVELPMFYVILALGQTTTTFVAQNHGAGREDRCRKGVRISLIVALAATLGLSALMLSVGYWAFWVFDEDPAVIETGLRIIAVTFPFYFLYVFHQVLGDALRGYGATLGPMAVVVANICVVRTVLLALFTAQAPSVEAVAAVYPVTWAATSACMAVLYVRHRRRCAAREARGRANA